MSISAFIPFIFAVLCLGTGFYVLGKAGKSYLSRPYFAASVAVSCYFSADFLAAQFGDSHQAPFFWMKVFISGAMFMIPALLNMLVPRARAKRSLLKVILFFSTLLGMSVFFFGDNQYLLPLTRFPLKEAAGGQGLPYLLFFLNTILFLPLAIMISLIQKRRDDLSALEDRQANFMILCIAVINIAVLLNCIAGFTGHLFFIGSPLLAIAFITMSYSIVRYRFLELDLIVNKTMLAFLFIAPLIILHIAISGIFLQTLGFLVATTFSLLIVISLVIFTPYRNFIQTMVEKAVYKGRYDYQRVLRELSQTLSAILDFDQLLNYIVHAIVQTVEVEKMAVFLEDEAEQDFRIKAAYEIEGRQQEELVLQKESRIITRIKKERNILIKSELKQFESGVESEELFLKLRSIHAELVAPLFFKERLIGLIVLSGKKSKQIYNQGDVDVLGTFAVEASKAVEHVRLYSEAIIDSATKVFNQNYFLMRLREEIARSKRYGHCISLMFIDIDRFRKVDSTFGHAKTDLLLRAIGLLLKTKVRNVDILARYSSGKFAVILPETAQSVNGEPGKIIKKHIGDTMLVAERLRSSIESFKNEQGGRTMSVTASIGVAYFNGEDKHFTEETFIEQAEKALVRAKRAGKNKVVCFENKE